MFDGVNRHMSRWTHLSVLIDPGCVIMLVREPIIVSGALRAGSR